MNHLLLTGNPGVGKTTLIREAINPHLDVVGGFITLEVRGPKGEREGYEVISLPDKQRGTFAAKNIVSDVRLNKYGLDLSMLDFVGTSALERAMKNASFKLIVIDEIGAMEAESPAFRKLALEALKGSKPVLATIRAHSQPFTDEIKKISGLTLLELTRADYAKTKDQVNEWLKKVLLF